jgi:protein-arginine kinase activator protein McsA
MTAEEHAENIVDEIISSGACQSLTFHLRVAVMIESLNNLIELFVDEENYEKAALFRDIIIELRRYENGGDKSTYIDQGLHS